MSDRLLDKYRKIEERRIEAAIANLPNNIEFRKKMKEAGEAFKRRHSHIYKSLESGDEDELF